MSHDERILAIDIGNSRVHIGLVDTVNMTCGTVDAFPLSEYQKSFNLLGQTLSGTILCTAVVSGVVAGVTEDIVTCLQKMEYDVHRFTSMISLPFSVKYENRELLGTDRCANALYVYHRFPGQSAIIVSIGSAVVVDFFEDNTFYGGAILPGIRLQYAALSEHTDALPTIVISGDTLSTLPAISTETCMAAGVLHGIAGAVEHIVGQIISATDCKNVQICVTGGDWPLIAPYVRLSFSEIPEMTLVGTALGSGYF